MSEQIQRIINRGILEEDHEGILYLSAKTKEAIISIQEDDVLTALIEEEASNEEDLEIGFWTLVFFKCCPEGVTKEEAKEGVETLMGWNRGAKKNTLDEWRMKLRLR